MRKICIALAHLASSHSLLWGFPCSCPYLWCLGYLEQVHIHGALLKYPLSASLLTCPISQNTFGPVLRGVGFYTCISASISCVRCCWFFGHYLQSKYMQQRNRNGTFFSIISHIKVSNEMCLSNVLDKAEIKYLLEGKLWVLLCSHW